MFLGLFKYYSDIYYEVEGTCEGSYVLRWQKLRIQYIWSLVGTYLMYSFSTNDSTFYTLCSDMSIDLCIAVLLFM